MGESSFWYRPTRVVPDQRPLNGRCCCCCVRVVICLEQGADCLHMVQLMPRHPKTPSSLALFKSRLVLPFWYRLTQVVLETRPLNRCSSCIGFALVLECFHKIGIIVTCTFSAPVTWTVLAFVVVYNTGRSCFCKGNTYELQLIHYSSRKKTIKDIVSMSPSLCGKHLFHTKCMPWQKTCNLNQINTNSPKSRYAITQCHFQHITPLQDIINIIWLCQSCPMSQTF